MTSRNGSGCPIDPNFRKACGRKAFGRGITRITKLSGVIELPIAASLFKARPSHKLLKPIRGLGWADSRRGHRIEGNGSS